MKVQRPAAAAKPVRIQVPALGIDQGLVELVVNGSSLQVPDDYADVGWWRDGPRPGEDGAAVMVGHVDSTTGPAVFYHLSALNNGNRIVIDLEGGVRKIFAVRTVRVHRRSDVPSSRVYRTQGRPGLNLLTCGGTFDAEAGHYTSNVVAYAELVRTADAGTPPGRRTKKSKDGGSR